MNSEIDLMRAAGRATAATLDFITPYVQEGITTDELDTLAHTFIVKQSGGYPANLNYLGFPKSICTSVNQVIAHGIPNTYKLKQGDILNIDVAVRLNDRIGDSSRMFCIGKVSAEAQKLVDQTYLAMWAGIRAAVPGRTTGDIGAAIMNHAFAHQLGIVVNYSGHGVGQVYHQLPEILNVGIPGTGTVLIPKMTFTIEPMLTLGFGENHVESNGWTVVTNDNSWSAQWEHTVLITSTGVEVLTLGKDEQPAQILG